MEAVTGGSGAAASWLMGATRLPAIAGLEHVNKSCSHRPAAGPALLRRRPAGPWLQRLQFYLNCSNERELYVATDSDRSRRARRASHRIYYVFRL